jgi:hypothetical protein
MGTYSASGSVEQGPRPEVGSGHSRPVLRLGCGNWPRDMVMVYRATSRKAFATAVVESVPGRKK